MFAPKHLRRVVPGHSLALWPILNPAVDRRWVYMASQQLRLASLQDCDGQTPEFGGKSPASAATRGRGLHTRALGVLWAACVSVCRPCASRVAAFPRRNGVFRAGEI